VHIRSGVFINLLNAITIDFLMSKRTTTSLLYELIDLRDNYLVFSGDFSFNHSDFLAPINCVSTAV